MAHLAVCLYFRPSALEMVNLEQAFRDALKRRIAQEHISVSVQMERYLEAVIRCPKEVGGCLWHRFCRRSSSTESNPQLGGQGGEVGFPADYSLPL